MLSASHPVSLPSPFHCPLAHPSGIARVSLPEVFLLLVESALHGRPELLKRIHLQAPNHGGCVEDTLCDGCFLFSVSGPHSPTGVSWDPIKNKKQSKTNKKNPTLMVSPGSGPFAGCELDPPSQVHPHLTSCPLSLSSPNLALQFLSQVRIFLAFKHVVPSANIPNVPQHLLRI